MHRIPLERCSSLVMCNNILISDSGVSNGTSTCQIFDFYVGTSTYIICFCQQIWVWKMLLTACISDKINLGESTEVLCSYLCRREKLLAPKYLRNLLSELKHGLK